MIHRDGKQVVLEEAPRTFTQRFLDLAGSAKEFPYPPEPPEVEAGPKLR